MSTQYGGRRWVDVYFDEVATALNVTYVLGIDHRDPGFVSWVKLPHVRREARLAHLERKRRRKQSGR